MNRFVSLFAIMLLTVTSYCMAQDQGEEEPLPPKRTFPAKLGGAGGFTPSWLFLDIDPINSFLRNANALEFSNGRLLLTGGQGYGYILFVKNLRVGGVGASGSMKSRSLLGSTRREVELSVGFGGVTVDYVFPVASRFDLTIGTMLGWGGMDLTITRDNGGPKVWGDLWNEFGTQQPAQEYTRKLSGSFFILEPSVNVEFALLRWVGLRAGVSYLGMSSPEWKMDDKYEIFGVPSNINGKGWMINTGIFVGTFVF
jgi:hypothetical protein